MLNSSFRDYIKANVFDGEESGVVTMKISVLLNQISELYLHYILSQFNGDQLERYIKEYYGLVEKKETVNAGDHLTIFLERDSNANK